MKRFALVLVAIASTAALAQFDDDLGEILGIGSAGGGGPRQPTFDFNAAAFGSGPSALAPLVVNGTTLAKQVDCRGEQVSGTTIVCATGGTFTEGNGGVGSPTSGLGVPFTESAARGVSFAAGGKAYVAPNGSVGNVSTDDIVFEFVAQNPGAGYTIAGNYNGVANGGWELLWGGGNSITMTLQPPGGGTISASSTATLVNGVWYHVMVFVKRSTAIRFVVDGAFDTNSAQASTTSITSSNSMVLSGRPGSAGQTGPQVLDRFTMSTCTGCLNTTAEMDSIAATRFARLTDVYPAITGGTAAPSVMTRATTAFIDVDRDGDGTRRMFLVSPGWPRVVRRKDTGAVYRTGFLAEGQATNLMLQSQTFNSATWTKTNTTVTADQATAPDATVTADAVKQTASAGSVTHCVSQAATLTATGYKASIYLQAGAFTWAYLNDSTIANGATWINLSTCAKGTQQAGVSQAFVSSWGSSWCSLGIHFTGTAAAHTIQVCSSNADNTTAFDAGAGTATMMSAWGAQVEADVAEASPSSYIATTSATVTRNADVLSFKGNDGNAATATAGVTVAVNYVLPNETAISNGPAIGDIATDSTNYVFEGYTDATPRTNAIGSTGGVQQFALQQLTSTNDGGLHEMRLIYFPNDSELWLDGALKLTDNTVTLVASAPTTIDIGNYATASGGSGGQAGVAISRLRIFPRKVVTSGVIP
jgi:hypothetical protein